MREFFVEARDWCVLVRLSRVACVGGVRMVAVAWQAGPVFLRDITGALRVSRNFRNALIRVGRDSDPVPTVPLLSH